MYKVTQQVTDLVEQLFSAGYEGEVYFTNSYCSGTSDVLGDAYSLEISGFCKETLHIVEDTETKELIFVGRYTVEDCCPTVDGIVELAWRVYKTYKGSGHSRPMAFEDLFRQKGYIKRKEVPAKAVWEEVE